MTHVVDFAAIWIPPERQRVDVDPEHIVELADSITDNGLFHPPIVRQGIVETHSNGVNFTATKDAYILVAGECRLKAIQWLWEMGRKLKYGTEEFEPGRLPVNFLGELSHIEAFRAELDENLRRRDLSWQDRVRATAQLAELMRLEAQRDNLPAPSIATVAKESRPDEHPDAASKATRKELIVSRHLDKPSIAKAKTVDEAFKILKREEDLAKATYLAKEIGMTYSSAAHTLWLGDCAEKLKTLDSESFDCILTDPPYGINAQDFGDSDGKAQGAHFYDDSYSYWVGLMQDIAGDLWRIAKPQAHLYMFCDIENFEELKNLLQCGFKLAQVHNWHIFRTPLIWVNPTGQRAPWPHTGPQRKWQAILYAVKGDRPCKVLAPDVLTWPSDPNLNHQAQKPVALYSDLLRRTCNPGDKVLDPFCGTGTIFAAAHPLKLYATGVEKDEAAYGIAAKRLKELK